MCSSLRCVAILNGPENWQTWYPKSQSRFHILHIKSLSLNSEQHPFQLFIKKKAVNRSSLWYTKRDSIITTSYTTARLDHSKLQILSRASNAKCATELISVLLLGRNVLIPDKTFGDTFFFFNCLFKQNPAMRQSYFCTNGDVQGAFYI